MTSPVPRCTPRRWSRNGFGKNSVGALELKRQLGVTYKTAWLLKHELLQTMLLREEPRRLEGQVEIEDAYLGGERVGHINGGIGAYNKSAFVAAAQSSEDGMSLFMWLTTIKTFTKQTLVAWAKKNLVPYAHVVSDGFQCFTHVTKMGSGHEPYISGGGREAAQTPLLR